MAAVIAVNLPYVTEKCADPLSRSFEATCDDAGFQAFAFMAQLLWPNAHRYQRYSEWGTFSGPRNGTILEDLQMGLFLTEMGSYHLTPKRLNLSSVSFSFPVNGGRESLYYSSLLMPKVKTTLWEKTLALLSPAPLGVVLPTLAILGLILLIGPLLKKHWAGLASAFTTAVLLQAYGQNAKGKAIDIFRKVSPFDNLDQLILQLETGRIQMTFRSPIETSFAGVLSHSLRRIADTFPSNPPVFLVNENRGLDFVERPNEVYFGSDAHEGQYPCMVEAKWMREFTTPEWGSLIFRKEGSRKEVEAANFFATAWEPYQRNYLRMRSSRKPCPGEDSKSPYQPLGAEFVKDLTQILVFVFLTPILAFALELCVSFCRARFLASYHDVAKLFKFLAHFEVFGTY